MSDLNNAWVWRYLEALERRLEQHEIEAAVAEANGDLERAQ